MTWCNPNWEASILEPQFVVFSFLYQRFELASKSPGTTVKKRLFAKIVSRFSSRFFENISNSS